MNTQQQTNNETQPAKLTEREMILSALSAFIRQRPGLEFGNYGDVSSYRSEMRSITADRHDAETLLSAVGWRTGIDAVALRMAALHAYSGRLSIVDGPKGIGIDYCTGQYFPTEYRRAVCAVLASALWDYTREHCMPAPVVHRLQAWGGEFEPGVFGIHAACAFLECKGGRTWGHIVDMYRDGEGRPKFSQGDLLRYKFRKEFGARMQKRWFD